MYTSEADICNAALYKVGGARIISLSDNTREGKLCKDLYAKTRRRLLRSHPWGFATKRVSIPALITTPKFEFSKEYQLPADCLRVFKVEDDEIYPWRIEGKKLVTDNGAALIRYVYDNTDVSSYTDDFSDALAGALAVELSYPLSSSDTLRKEVFAYAQDSLRKARNANAQEGAGDRFYADEWLNSRY